MNKLKILLAFAVVATSSPAFAMPDEVSALWYGNMARRLQVMADNYGFCSGHNSISWICG